LRHYISNFDDELKYLEKHELSRRDFIMDMMGAGGLLGAGMTLPGAGMASFAPPDNEVVRIGYLPITDATALLVAHGMGFFEEEGLVAEKPTLIRGWSH
jgi:NitT/TauT family transport system substrate-binding protein